MNKPAAIIQARIGSTRLPGKVLATLSGKPLLQHVIERASSIKGVGQVIVATTTLDRDQPIVDLCESLNVAHFRGSENDVLDRYAGVARTFDLGAIVRITSDCPLLDPSVSAKVLGMLSPDRFDYVSNARPNSYPDGLDTEAFTRDVLEIAWREATRPSEREYVTQFIWSHPERFRIGSVVGEQDLSNLRWTVDTEHDLQFVRRVFEGLARRGWQGYDHREILRVLAEDQIQDASGQSRRNEGLLRTLRQEGRSREEIQRLMRFDQGEVKE